MAVNVVEILVRAKDMTAAGFGEAEASSNKMARAITRAGLVAAGGLAVIAVEATKMAVDFNAQMERLVTQAGVPQQKLAGLKTAVLNLAGSVGFSPDSLAESLYHVASNMQSMGASGQQMMNMVKVAAEGAKVGNADLVDVTNALTAAIASGIPGVKNYQQAMGMLNATVGSGDMTMQDLADALGSGVLAIGKQFGLTMRDAGAALATFGDNNIRGAKAGTELRMVIMDLTRQSKTGEAALEGIGLKAGELGRDMRRGGLLAAMTDLRNHLIAAKIPAKEWGSIMEEAFTKKSSAPLAILLGQFDRLKSKYPDLVKGADKFGQAWKDTQAQLKTKLSELDDGFKALMITIGEKLIPVVQNIVSWMLKHKQATMDVLIAVTALAGVLGTLAIAIKAVEIVTAAWEGIQAILDAELLANPIFLIITGLVLLGVVIYRVITHWKTFEKVTKEVFDAVWHAIDDAFHFVERIVGDVVSWIESHWQLLLGILTGPIGAAVIWIVDHWRMIYDGIVRVVGDVINFFRQLPGKILGALGSLASDLFNLGKNAIEGLWNGAKSIVGGVLSWAGGIGHSIANALGAAFGIHFSEPSEAEIMIRAGQKIPQGLARGMRSGLPELRAAAARLGLAGLPGLGAAGGGGGTAQLVVTGAGAPNFLALVKAIWPDLKMEIKAVGGGGTTSVQRALGFTH